MAKTNKADMSCARVKQYTAFDVSKAERHNHPNVALTTDGSAPAYTHGEDTRSIASMAFSFDKKAVKNAATMEAEKHEFLLYSEEELEELLDEKEKKDNEEA